MLKPRIRLQKSNLIINVKIIAQCNDSNVLNFAYYVLKYYVKFNCKLFCSISSMLITNKFLALRFRLCSLLIFGLIRS